MFYRLIIDNYLSFCTPQQFDMFPNNKRTTLKNHIYFNASVPVLKSSSIYGANDAGKSNFIKAMLFLKLFCTDINFIVTSDWYEKNHFLLTKEQNNAKPISFVIEFSKNNRAYIYTIEISRTGIKNEELYKSSVGKKHDNELIFRRTRENIDTIREQMVPDVKKILKRQIKVHPFSSLFVINKLSHIISDEDVGIAASWFEKNLDVITANYKLPWLIDILSKTPEMMDYVKRIFKKVGLGINEFKIEKQDFDEWFNNEGKSKLSNEEINKLPDEENHFFVRMENNKNLFSISEENGVRLVKELIFNQIGQKGYKRDMDITTQSDGTIRLLTLVPAFYKGVTSESTIFIDEIERSMHPILMKKLIKYYSSTKTKGQIVFTTHLTFLLNQQELLRPDEIWFIEKEDGATHMYSLNDFKEHNTISLENGYLDGRYGAIPNINCL